VWLRHKIEKRKPKKTLTTTHTSFDYFFFGGLALLHYEGD
jgi:hypothetical protein